MDARGFSGTFCYCMAALPAAGFTTPFSPVATVLGAMVLALVCVAWLLFFIQHISQAIASTISLIASRATPRT